MFNVAQRSKIYLFIETVSFHKQIDGLAAVVRQKMALDPLSGNYYVFRSKSKHSARILYFDGSGFTLVTKRLSKGIIRHWPTSKNQLQYTKFLARELNDLIWPESSEDI